MRNTTVEPTSLPLPLTRKDGFTLLEVIVATTFLMVAVVGILGLVVPVLATVSSSQNNVIAAQLAQEGMEIVRNIRDTNWQAGRIWTDGLVFGGGQNVRRTNWNAYDSVNNTLTLPPACSPWPSCTQSPLNFTSNNGYAYFGPIGTETIFYRTITVDQISTDQLRIIVEVTWLERGQNRSVKVEDRLFNWF